MKTTSWDLNLVWPGREVTFKPGLAATVWRRMFLGEETAHAKATAYKGAQ